MTGFLLRKGVLKILKSPEGVLEKGQDTRKVEMQLEI